MEFTNRLAAVDQSSQILLTFSDGETQTVDLERDVTIAELAETNSVNSVRIEVTGVYDSMNNGAMEIKFYGSPSDYSCVPGQGKLDGDYVNTNSNNESDCGNTCTADAECIGLDYTIQSASNSCRLYKVDDPRSDPGKDSRMYCTPTSDAGNNNLFKVFFISYCKLMITCQTEVFYLFFYWKIFSLFGFANFAE